jgi:hypothetical protein
LPFDFLNVLMILESIVKEMVHSDKIPIPREGCRSQ